ncbi:MAG: S8 family serine peptidase [Verrucomicrobiota bacterium]
MTPAELNPRVTELDGNTTNSYHSTAVCGILAAVGVNLYSGTNLLGPLAKGMAYAAQVQARDFKIDLGEMTGAVGTNHMRLSNQSYGWIAGWYYDGATWYWYGYPSVSATQDPAFGNYTTNASNYDNLVQGAPTYLQVWAAGNDQGEAPPVQPTNHVERTGATTAYRPPDGDQGGYDTMSQQGCAKNVLTVGAIYPLTSGYAGPTNVVLAPFSSCGPTDDGRIKPDVVADGINDITPGAGSDTEYVQWPGGTSFAAPGIAGSVGLLSQFYKQLHPNSSEPLASTLKGLAIHTADSATTNAGPSYRFGWGVMNTRTAATVIKQDATNGLKNQIKEVLLTNNSTIQFPVVASAGTSPLKITICWTDPAGTPNNVTNLDNPTPKLVNDLDLRVISPSGSTNLPWVLNPDLTNQISAARSAAATTGDDNRNNVEQVYVAHPTNATYLVRVTHKSNLQSNTTQWASILISGNVPQATPPLVINQMAKTATNTLAIGWPAVVGAQYQLQSKTNLTSTNWFSVDGIISARLTNVVTLVPFSQASTAQFFRVAQLP